MRIAAVFALVIAFVAPAAAHHGWGSYDAENPVTLESTIDTAVFENPHVTITLTVVVDGKLWTVTLAPPSRMNNRGALAEIVAVGKTVKAHGYPKRDVTPEIRAEWIEIDGQHFELR